MSSNDVNIKKETKRHRGPLLGIAAVIIFAGIISVFMLGDAVNGDDPTENDAPVPANSAPQ